MNAPLSSELRCAVTGLFEHRCIHCLFPKLEAVAKAAKELVVTARGYSMHHEIVSEPAMVILESALEAAGYGMTEEEFEEAI